MAPRVTVNLTALSGNISPLLRILTLDAERPSVPVGRASKTLSKGLQGAQDNAWFDSPVMSRDHAELVLDLETDTLSIRDIGSMHGTFVNGNRIVVDHANKLNSGDEIVFGAEVRRGTEVFPACAFRVSYAFKIYRPTNTYSFPEASDVEDGGEEFDFSDEDSDHDQASSEEESSVVTSDPKVSQSHFAIDLTRDESPIRPSFPSIDLTGDTPVESTPAAMVPVDAFDFEAVVGQTAVEGEFGKEETQISLEIELDSQSSRWSPSEESDTHSQHIEEEEEIKGNSVIDDSRDKGEDSGAHLEAEGNHEIDLDDDDDMDGSLYDYDSDMATRSRSLNSDDAKYWEGFAGPSSPTVIKGVERIVIVNEGYDDFGYPKAANEATHLIPAKSLLHIMPGSSTHPLYPKNTYPSAGPTSGVAINMLNSPTTPGSNTSNLASLSSTGRALFFNRHPSPSDAAMAKSAEMKEPPVQVSYIRSTAILGDGSGKEDFFMAREHNKAKLQEASRLQEGMTGNGACTDGSEGEAGVQHVPALPARVIKACVAKRIHLVRASGDLEAKSDTAPPEAPSSFSYLPSVDSSLRSASQAPTEPQAIRSGLRIDEIIDRDSINQDDVAPTKRKADEISKAVEEDVRLWASTLKPLGASINPEYAPAPRPAPLLLDISHFPENRPTKKIRKFVENIAYAALGGVAVGAALFGSLVATAPDFM